MSSNIPDTEALLTKYGGLTEGCCRSSSATQITKLSDCEVRTVSEGSGKALSSEYNPLSHDNVTIIVTIIVALT